MSNETVKVLEIPGATRLAPEEWAELMRDVAFEYEAGLLTKAERKTGITVVSANDLRAFAEWFESQCRPRARRRRERATAKRKP